MNEVYRDDFIKVLQSDEGHTYVCFAEKDQLIIRKHCKESVAQLSFGMGSHEDACEAIRWTDSYMAYVIKTIFP